MCVYTCVYIYIYIYIIYVCVCVRQINDSVYFKLKWIIYIVNIVRLYLLLELIRAGTINRLIDNRIGTLVIDMKSWTSHSWCTAPSITNRAVFHIGTFALICKCEISGVVVTINLNMGVASGYTHLITSDD